MRNKLVYSCIAKIHYSGFDELLESIFCLLLVVEAFSLQEVVKVSEEVAVGWQEARWIWQMRQNFWSTICSTFEVLLVRCVVGCCLGEGLCDVWLGVVMEKACAICGWLLSWRRIWPFLLTSASYRHCSFQCISLICLAFFSGVMVLLGFRKLVDQTGSRPSKQWLWSFFFFSASLTLGSALELLLGPTTELVITGCHIKSTFSHMSQSNWEIVCYCIE